MILTYNEYQLKLKTNPIENWFVMELAYPYVDSNILGAFAAGKKYIDDIEILKKWIIENQSSDVYIYAINKFAFENPDDGLIFKLRFG